MQSKFRRFLLITSLLIVGTVALLGGAVADRIFGLRPLDRWFPKLELPKPITQRQLLNEESVTIDIAKKVSPSVVTVSIVEPKRKIIQFDPFSGFNSQEQGGQQDIGTGFIVDSTGLIVTNKHVVSTGGSSYKVITKDNKEYEVKKIYRDPANDIALLKVDPSASSGLAAVTLGDSDLIQVGQYVAAIGTALGQFRQSITTGVVSGIGRSIEAGSGNPFEGYAEQLDNVIQTDAAINPGNSGGPLVNSSGAVVGINVAVAAGAQNVGFALPVNVVSRSIEQFRKTGEFARPFLGVQYQMVSREAAIANNLPEGAYVRDVIAGSSATAAGIRAGDIITKFGGERVAGQKEGLAQLVNKHKVGERVDVEIWRDGKTQTLSLTLTEASQ